MTFISSCPQSHSTLTIPSFQAEKPDISLYKHIIPKTYKSLPLVKVHEASLKKRFRAAILDFNHPVEDWMRECYRIEYSDNFSKKIESHQTAFINKINRVILQIWDESHNIESLVKNIKKEEQAFVNKIACMGKDCILTSYSLDDVGGKQKEDWYKKWVHLALSKAAEGNPKYFSAAMRIATSSSFFQNANIHFTKEESAQLTEKWLPYIKRLSNLGNRGSQYMMHSLYQDNRAYIFSRWHHYNLSQKQRLDGLQRLAKQGMSIASFTLERALKLGLANKGKLEPVSDELKKCYSIRKRQPVNRNNNDTYCPISDFDREISKRSSPDKAREAFIKLFNNRSKIQQKYYPILLNSVINDHYCRLPIGNHIFSKLYLSLGQRHRMLETLAKENCPEAKWALDTRIYDRELFGQYLHQPETKKVLGSLLTSASMIDLTHDRILSSSSLEKRKALKELLSLRRVYSELS